jgi:propanol-preferring alcohol dehydrogenase
MSEQQATNAAGVRRTMRAMRIETRGAPLALVHAPVPRPGPDEVLLRVHACGVCRTDLHILDGELADGRYPLIPGHQIVGSVVSAPAGSGLVAGARIGVPWLGHTCGTCSYCGSGRENLCDHAEFTGYHRAGGFAEYAVADARFCFSLPGDYPDEQAAPLLCAGLIGYRALALAGAARTLGFYGFGAAAHILTQIAAWQGRAVYAFTRPGDAAGQAFARELGAVWAGDTATGPPLPLDAALIFAPEGALVPIALRQVAKGGIVVCAGIHMSDIPAFPYADLWGERRLCSVANLTREDGLRLLEIAPRVPVRTHVETFPLEAAGEALTALRAGRVRGAAVIVVD